MVPPASCRACRWAAAAWARGPGSRLKPRPFGEAMADHLGRGRVGSLLDILTQESNAGRSRGVPEPKGRSSAYKHPLLFNVDEEATRKRTGGYGDQSNDLDARNGVEASGDEVDGSRAAATWAACTWPI